MSPLPAGGNVHKPSGGESEDPRGAEALAGGRLGPDHQTEAGEGGTAPETAPRQLRPFSAPISDVSYSALVFAVDTACCIAVFFKNQSKDACTFCEVEQLGDIERDICVFGFQMPLAKMNKLNKNGACFSRIVAYWGN